MTAVAEQDELLPAEAGIAVPAEPIVITRPGIYDLADHVYHSDPVPGGSLSSSIARKLLSECPAVVEHEMKHGQGTKKEWDAGTAFHKYVLGKGPDIEVFPGLWNTNDIKARIQECRDAGRIPLKPAQVTKAKAMAQAVRDHPDAGPLFAEGTGMPERSIFWTHERTGMSCRAMLDWLSLTPKLPPLIVDLKSTKDVSKRGVMKAITEYRYYQQDPWYRAAVASLGYDLEDVGFVFVFVGSDAPHLVTVTVIDDEALAEGMACNEDAIDEWVRCQDTGIWPPYAEGIITTSLPNYALRH